jgi:hypothetical protein
MVPNWSELHVNLSSKAELGFNERKAALIIWSDFVYILVLTRSPSNIYFNIAHPTIFLALIIFQELSFIELRKTEVYLTIKH